MLVAPYRMARSTVRKVQTIHNMPHINGWGDLLGTNQIRTLVNLMYATIMQIPNTHIRTKMHSSSDTDHS